MLRHDGNNESVLKDSPVRTIVLCFCKSDMCTLGKYIFIITVMAESEQILISIHATTISSLHLQIVVLVSPVKCNKNAILMETIHVRQGLYLLVCMPLGTSRCAETG